MAMASDVIETKVIGYRMMLLGLALKTALLTFLTFGFYGPWARTRLRRWLWSSVKPGAIPLEYTGQPQEKLMGFFVAAVFVAFYVGIFVMLFLFFGLQYAGSLELGGLIALLLLVPLYFFAQYRGRRYLLNHTSWRGISFSMEPGALGYMWRALFWHALSIASLGLLGPYRRFVLHRYMINRTFFGDKRFVQTGSSFMLYRAVSIYFIGIFATAAVTIYAITVEQYGILGFYFLTTPLMMVGWAYYRVAGFRMLYSAVAFDGESQCDIYPRTGRIIKIYLLGYLFSYLIISILVPMFLAVAVALTYLVLGEVNIQMLEDLPPIFFLVGPYLLYILIFVLGAQLRLGFITFPMLQHALDSFVIHDAQHLNTAKQGEDRHMHDADGLSAIFDFGGGI